MHVGNNLLNARNETDPDLKNEIKTLLKQISL